MLPIARLRRVYHVGSLNPQDKGVRGPSLEGRGLSVSLHPDAWTRIAKLGGLPWWELKNPAARFLDVHRLSETQKEQIKAWAVGHGLAEEKQGWAVTWYDDELERECEMHFIERHQASQELDEGKELKPVPTLKATEKLNTHAGHNIDPLLVFDHVALRLAEEVLGVDGVWWGDVLDPVGLSAPRGVIFTQHLNRWARRCLTERKTA
jgi:hypothetical protein